MAKDVSAYPQYLGIKTEEVVELRKKGWLIREIAEHFGASNGAICYHIDKAKRLGMDVPSGFVRRGNQHKGVETEEVVRLFQQGKSFRQMQDILGVGAPAIYGHLEKAGLVERDHRTRPRFCPVCGLGFEKMNGRIIGGRDRFDFICGFCEHEIRVEIKR